MFTGIVQAVATIEKVSDHNGIRSIEIAFPDDFCQDLAVGASVSVDGVCLTVTKLLSPASASFDVMLQSLNITTLGSYAAGSKINAERAAKEGAEIGGHPLSGHIDFCASIAEIEHQQDNFRLRIAVEPDWLRYIFAKGYIAVNGASLTVATVDKLNGWFEVWLIPETLRMTTMGIKKTGDLLNIEIERDTQVQVDTIRHTLEENLGELLPLLERLLAKEGVDVNSLASPGKDT